MRHMLMAARTNVAWHWKRDTLQAISDLKTKFGKYSAM